MNKRVPFTQKEKNDFIGKLDKITQYDGGKWKKEHDDSHDNVTDNSIDHTKEVKRTSPDIKSPDMMEECEDMKHNDNNNNEIETSLDTWDKKI